MHIYSIYVLCTYMHIYINSYCFTVEFYTLRPLEEHPCCIRTSRKHNTLARIYVYMYNTIGILCQSLVYCIRLSYTHKSF